MHRYLIIRVDFDADATDRTASKAADSIVEFASCYGRTSIEAEDTTAAMED